MKKNLKNLFAVLLIALAVLVGWETAEVSLSYITAPQEGQTVSSEKPSAEKKKKNKKNKKQAETGSEENQEQPDSSSNEEKTEDTSSDLKITEDGEYTSKEEVAAYIHEFHHLPSNYITKREAQDLGWDRRAGNLDEVAPGKSIGGDYFGNYEGLLPTDKEYRECDIDFTGGQRNAKRLIYTKDGDVYYTEDHYNTFEQLY